MQGSDIIRGILEELASIIIGKEDVMQLLIVAMLSEGHVLLEGPPGVAKTLLAKSLAKAMGGTFKRIQMTPDLLPADIIGTTYYNTKTSEWELKQGPLFANVALIDELNRATPKTQAALLEAMQERQVTIEGHTMPLPRPFLVLATQLPYGGEGTYPLTDVQVDRFAYRINVNYPSPEEEVKVIENIDFIERAEVKSVAAPASIAALIDEAKKIHVSDAVKNYIVNLVNWLRARDEVRAGPSPRASIWLYKGGRALAYIKGRGYATPDDIKQLAATVLVHRLKIKPEYEVEGLNPEELVNEALNQVEVPKA